MPRYVVLLLVALVGALSAGDASAADGAGCAGFDVGQFLSSVPYFSRKMVVAEQPAGDRVDGVALRHQDDERLRAVFRLVPVPVPVPETRAEFVRQTDAELSRKASVERRMGNRVDVGLFPYDPVSWSFVSTPPKGGEGRGDLTVRIAPTCRFVVDWAAPGDPVLAGRVQEFGIALTALRTLAGKRMAPSGFLVDEYVPTGTQAVIGGFVVPLAAAVALVYVLRDMFFLGRPGRWPRVATAVACVAAIAAIAVQYPAYVGGLGEAKFLDQAMLLATAAVLLAAATALDDQRATLYGLAVATVFGVSVAVTTSLSWTPDKAVSGAVAAVMFAAGVSGLWSWRMRTEPTRRTAGKGA